MRHLRQNLVESWRPPKVWDFAPRRGGSNVVLPVMAEDACVARARHGAGDPYDPQAAPPDVATAVSYDHMDDSARLRPAQTSTVLAQYVVDGCADGSASGGSADGPVEVTLESRPGRLLDREPETGLPDDERWLLGAAVSTMRMLALHDPELTEAAEAAQRENIDAMCDPTLQEIPLEPDGEPSAENFRWWHRKWMYERCRERIDGELWTALGLPTWEELSRIIPRQPSYGPADGPARFIHGDIKSANLVPVNGALARAVARCTAHQPFYNALRDETIGPLAEESLAYLAAMRAEHGDGVVQDLFQRSGGLYEFKYREFEGLDPAAQLGQLVAQIQRLARADLETGLSLRARLILAAEMEDISEKLVGAAPWARMHLLSEFHSWHEQISSVPERDVPPSPTDLERSAVALVDHDLGLITHNQRSMMDLAVLVRLSPQWSQGECEAAYRDRRGGIHRDELERELLDYAWRSVVNDIMRATEGRVPVAYAVNAVVDFRVRAGLVPWAARSDALTDKETARRTRDLADEVTGLLGARVDLDHPDQPLAPFRLPATLRDHLPPGHRHAGPRTVRLEATPADRDEARRLNEGRDPEAGLVAACAVRRHEHARTAQRAAADAAAASLWDRMATGAFGTYKRELATLTAHRERNGIAPGKGPTPFHELVTAQPTPEHVLDAAAWRAHDGWSDQAAQGAENKRRVLHTTSASVTHSWLRWSAPGQGAVSLSAGDLTRSATPGLARVDEMVWKAALLPRTAETIQTKSLTNRLRGLGLEPTRDW